MHKCCSARTLIQFSSQEVLFFPFHFVRPVCFNEEKLCAVEQKGNRGYFRNFQVSFFLGFLPSILQVRTTQTAGELGSFGREEDFVLPFLDLTSMFGTFLIIFLFIVLAMLG